MKRLLVPDKVHQKSQFAVEMASCQSQLVVSKQECKKKWEETGSFCFRESLSEQCRPCWS